MPYEFARYLKIRAAYGATWSPDGRRIAFLTDITGVPQAWEVPAGGGWPEQLTFHDERVMGLRYSPTENKLIYSMDAGGNERSQLFLLEGPAGEERDLTQAPDAIHYFGGFAPDGGRIAYTATRRNGTDFDVYVQDSRLGARRLVPRRLPPPLEPRQRPVQVGPLERRNHAPHPARGGRPLP